MEARVIAHKVDHWYVYQLIANHKMELRRKTLKKYKYALIVETTFRLCNSEGDAAEWVKRQRTLRIIEYAKDNADYINLIHDWDRVPQRVADNMVKSEDNGHTAEDPGNQ